MGVPAHQIGENMLEVTTGVPQERSSELMVD